MFLKVTYDRPYSAQLYTRTAHSYEEAGECAEELIGLAREQDPTVGSLEEELQWVDVQPFFTPKFPFTHAVWQTYEPLGPSPYTIFKNWHES